MRTGRLRPFLLGIAANRQHIDPENTHPAVTSEQSLQYIKIGNKPRGDKLRPAVDYFVMIFFHPREDRSHG
jgi:hypothetical protein